MLRSWSIQSSCGNGCRSITLPNQSVPIASVCPSTDATNCVRLCVVWLCVLQMLINRSIVLNTWERPQLHDIVREVRAKQTLLPFFLLRIFLLSARSCSAPHLLPRTSCRLIYIGCACSMQFRYSVPTSSGLCSVDASTHLRCTVAHRRIPPLSG